MTEYHVFLQADEDNPQFLSIDACFRLCRRAKAGHSVQSKPLIEHSSFLSQTDVDAFVQSQHQDSADTLKVNHPCDYHNCIYQYHPNVKQNRCSDFKAGDAIRSRSRYHALDETAVFGAICRHDFPIRMLSLKHGERYYKLPSSYICPYTSLRLAYADYLISTMMDLSLLSRRVNLLYDIGCKLESHWKVRQNGLTDMYMFIPAMHFSGQFTKVWSLDWNDSNTCSCSNISCICTWCLLSVQVQPQESARFWTHWWWECRAYVVIPWSVFRRCPKRWALVIALIFWLMLSLTTMILKSLE